MTARYDRLMAKFADPAEARHWREVFHGDLDMAADWRPHFADAHVAYRWFGNSFMPGTAAYLHAHNAAPEHDALVTFLAKAEGGPGSATNLVYREAALALAHPELAPDDRQLLVAAGITLAEACNLLTTGIDRPLLKTLAGLR